MLTSQQVYAVLFVHLGVLAVVTSSFVVARMLLPNLLTRARVRLAQRLWLPVVIGVLVSIPWMVLSIGLIQAGQAAPPLGGIGAIIGLLWLSMGLIGGGALAEHIGRSATGADDPWRATVRGGAAVVLTWMLPVIGWFFLLPLTLAVGVGCFIVGLFPMRERAVDEVLRPRLQADVHEGRLEGELAFEDHTPVSTR